MKIVVADDHAIVREGLRRLIHAQDTLEVVAEVESAVHLKQVVAELQPELILLDYRMPGADTYAIAEYIKKRYPKTKILVFTAVQSGPLLKEMIESRIDGLVLKQDSNAELIAAINQIGQGIRYFSPSVQDCLKELEVYLTGRELQILNMIVMGLPRSQIAKQLEVSPETVKTHRKNLMKKLNVQTALELVNKAKALNL